MNGQTHPDGTYLFELPSLGADMDEGRIVDWKVAVGDEVHRGDVLASVETDKSDIDVEIWSDGVVDAYLVDLDELVSVGTPVMRLRTLAGGPVPTSNGPARSPDPAPARPAPQAGARAPVAGPVGPPVAARGSAVRASPRARRAAVEAGVDLSAIVGTGPNGAIVVSDVEAAHRAPAPTAAREPTAGDTSRATSHATAEATSADRMRALIAERMSTSNREIPHYYLERHIDLTALGRWLDERNRDVPIAQRLIPAAAFVRAVALAAARHPELNGWWRDGRFEQADAVHVAVAVALRRGGLLTPKIAETDQCSIEEIMDALRELVGAARTGALRSSWMSGASITVTNLGDLGADLVHGVISPPQVALVGIGRTTPRPWVVDGELAVCPVVTVTLAADHRATDGATGSRFLATVADLLERPEEL